MTARLRVAGSRRRQERRVGDDLHVVEGAAVGEEGVVVGRVDVLPADDGPVVADLVMGPPAAVGGQPLFGLERTLPSVPSGPGRIVGTVN